MFNKEFDERAKKIFIGEGPNKETLEFLVTELANIYDALTMNPQGLDSEDVKSLIDGFQTKLDERFKEISAEEAFEIAKEFSKKAQTEFFKMATKEDVQRNKEGRGPYLKWIFVYQNIIKILIPNPCAMCKGSCEGCGKKPQK